MSKVIVGVLFAALVLIALAVTFDVMFVAGGSGVVMVVALAYSYIVHTRELEGEPSLVDGAAAQ